MPGNNKPSLATMAEWAINVCIHRVHDSNKPSIHFNWSFFHRNSNSMEILFHSHLDANTVIAKNILYMARQLFCCGMCKNLLQSDGQQWNYSKAKFPSNFNCGQKIISETGPRFMLDITHVDYVTSLACWKCWPNYDEMLPPKFVNLCLFIKQQLKVKLY